MRSTFSIVLLTLALASGCDATVGEGQLSAEDALTMAAITAEEEAAIGDDGDGTGMGDAPDSMPPRPLFRSCDAEKDYFDEFEGADGDADGDLNDDERAAVHERHPRPPRHWHLLRMVYDADDSRDLDEFERIELRSDFTERCEAIHTRILEDFDADDDGVLSDAEKDDARDAFDARRAEMKDSRPDKGSKSKSGSKDGDKDCDELPAPLVEAFDTDGSGDLDDAEMSTLRETVRDRVRSGEPLLPKPSDEGEISSL